MVSRHVAEIQIENPVTSQCPAIRISSPKSRPDLHSTVASSHDCQLRELDVARGVLIEGDPYRAGKT